MNHFTKEELQSIEYGLESIGLSQSPLRLRVLAMIDNYCEHKKDVWPIYTLRACIPCAGLCFECNQPVGKEFICE